MDKTRYQEFGKLIQSARLQKGLSGSYLAKSIGMSASFYSRIERGTKLPSVMVFAAIWRRLRFDADIVLDTFPMDLPELKRARRKTTRLRSEFAGEHAGLGRILARRRIAIRVTQQTLADAIGVTRRQLARFESGHALPTITRFAKLRRVLGLNANRVLHRLLGGRGLLEPFEGFGATIGSARAGRSMAPGQVAHASGCPLPRYRAIERGSVLPSMREAVMIHRTVRYDANAAIQWLWESGAIEKMS